MENLITFLFILIWILIPVVQVVKQYKQQKNKDRRNINRPTTNIPVPVEYKNDEIKVPEMKVKKIEREPVKLNRKKLEVKSLERKNFTNIDVLSDIDEKNNQNYIRDYISEETDNQEVISLDKISVKKAIIFSEILRAPYLDYYKK